MPRVASAWPLRQGFPELPMMRSIGARVISRLRRLYWRSIGWSLLVKLAIEFRLYYWRNIDVARAICSSIEDISFHSDSHYFYLKMIIAHMKVCLEHYRYQIFHAATKPHTQHNDEYLSLSRCHDIASTQERLSFPSILTLQVPFTKMLNIDAIASRDEFRPLCISHVRAWRYSIPVTPLNLAKRRGVIARR